MSLKLAFAGAAAVAAVLPAAPPAHAATIILNNLGGVTQGTAAFAGFATAANFWGSLIRNDVTIRLNVGFQSLGPGILGETGTSNGVVTVQDVEGQLAALGSSSVDALAVAHLPTLTNGSLSVYTPGYTDPVARTGVDTSTQVLDSDGSANNTFLSITTANAKALGFLGDDGVTADGTVEFSSDFNFDFNPKNGVSSNAIDFLGVAVHEIGHALGFDSGVDSYDILGAPNGELANQFCDPGVLCKDEPLNDFAVATPLDLFRYSALGGGTLTWAPGVASWFSLDGGATNLCNFATGQDNGDGFQASHWQRRAGAPCGAMDPAIAFGQEDTVSNLDLTAFDAIGYNLTFDPGVDPRSFSTGQIEQQFGIPEPGVWMLMILGLGLTGVAARRRAVTA